MAVAVNKQAHNAGLETQALATDTLASTTLLHELQFGEQLNQCVHQARRADFSLMLAMLCDDVREQSQFVLPQQQGKDAARVYNDSVLRKQFNLPAKAPLALTKVEQIKQYNQASVIAENQLATLHLSNALNPKPIAFRDNNKHINHEIMSNTTLVCQAKNADGKANAVLNTRLGVDVEGWLQNIQTSLVKSRLVEGVAA